MNDLVKVFFLIQQDEDGYPDVGGESVLAIPAGPPDTYIIDNIPSLRAKPASAIPFLRLFKTAFDGSTECL